MVALRRIRCGFSLELRVAESHTTGKTSDGRCPPPCALPATVLQILGGLMEARFHSKAHSLTSQASLGRLAQKERDVAGLRRTANAIGQREKHV